MRELALASRSGSDGEGAFSVGPQRLNLTAELPYPHHVSCSRASITTIWVLLPAHGVLLSDPRRMSFLSRYTDSDGRKPTDISMENPRVRRSTDAPYANE